MPSDNKWFSVYMPSDIKWIGYKFIKRSTDNGGVLMELWQDKNDQWELVNSSMGIDPGWRQLTFASGPVWEGSKKVKSVAAPSKKEGLLSLSEQLEKLK